LVDVMLDIMQKFSLRGSSEAQDYLENKTAKITRRKIVRGGKFVTIGEKDEMFIDAVMGSYRQNSLMPILTGKQFPLGIRLNVMASLAKKGYIDSAYLGLTEDDGKQQLEMIERVYDEFGVIPAKILVNNLIAGETNMERLKAVQPHIEQILSKQDYRVLIRQLAKDEAMSSVYYLFYQSPFRYPGTESMSYERFINLVKASNKSLEDEKTDVVKKNLKEGYIKAGMTQKRADQVAEAVLSGRAPLPDDSPYLDGNGNFIPQKVDVLAVLGSSDAAEQAQHSFDSSIGNMVVLLKINDLLERIDKAIQKRFIKGSQRREDLAGQYEAIKGNIRLGVDLDSILNRLIALNDEIFPPKGRKRSLNEMVSPAINKKISNVTMWQDMIGLKKEKRFDGNLICLEVIDINLLVRNMGKMINFLHGRGNKLKAHEKEIIADNEIDSTQVFQIFFANLAASLKMSKDDPLYDIYVDLQGHLITAYDNYLKSVSGKVDIVGVPEVVYVDFVSKSSLIEFFRFADGAHCCLSSDPKVSNHYGGGVYEKEMPRYLTNATSFWVQFTTDERSGKQIGWFECWFGLDGEGKVFVGTELTYLSPGYHNKDLQAALLAKIEEILFSTDITKIGQAAFGNHASNALLPPDDYNEESLLITKLQSLNDGESIYEDADIESNNSVTVTLHVKHNSGKGVINLSELEDECEISLEYIYSDTVNEDLIEKLLTIEE